MSTSDEQPISADRYLRLGRPYWLPPDGHGNGLDALTWAQLARIPHAAAERLLAALRDKDIPGWTAPVDPHHHPEAATAMYDVWVATIDIDSAEDVAMALFDDR